MDAGYFKNLACGHCGRKGLMRLLAEYSERDVETLKSPCGYLVKESPRPWGVGYCLSLCLSCERPTLTRIDWHEDCAPGDYAYTVLYPREGSILKYLPGRAGELYLAALKAGEAGRCNFAGLLAGALDFICTSCGASGNSLLEKIEDLAEKGKIPERLASLAGRLALLKGSACFDGGRFAEEEAAVLKSLCEAVLEYLYRAPALVERVAAGIAGLKAKGREISSRT
ncbi:MAG: hypothetical protein HPY89_12970 [Pelotomaculum sp.]|nr:hypothetical protein [Pelotomaculum sp.]